ncbi:uncharacterized protein [Physcomitrium patens]|uniref:Uncharacterized protein n=1 Tax=Physcomitrium patens TaxID=3218 RepID=A9TR82_PHYPA|nr:uncharacterized protein LOC112282801 [Physcomitrium patens]PNR63535.1 hypothetical protein PHYPA_001961 [Physcomitrium patens]|eukprot:XP_024376651.1 uncharacterized protein LOC112282801 [Physcomitrella patens]
MGATDSKLLDSEGAADVIETIRAGRSAEELDPYIERLQNLRVALLVEPEKRKPDVSYALSVNNITWPTAALDAATTAELLALYQEWQRLSAAEVSKNQEEIGFKIEAVEAVAMKLLQRLNYSASVMKTSAAHLQDVQYLKVELREMKRALNIVLGKYEALCKRVEQQGPDFLRGVTRPSSRASSALGTEITLGGALQQIFRSGSSMVYDTRPP